MPQNTHKDWWSDLDLLVVVETLDFEVKRTIAKALIQLENSSGVKHGLNVIVKEEFLNPKTPDILLDGKTLQAFIDIKKYPDRIVYLKKSAGIQDIYMPNNEMMKNYSISNIGMFLRRNRRTLTRASDDSIDELKELLKKEIRAAFIITKLAVQYFTGIPQYSNNDALKQSKLRKFIKFMYFVLTNMMDHFHMYIHASVVRNLLILQGAALEEACLAHALKRGIHIIIPAEIQRMCQK